MNQTSNTGRNTPSHSSALHKLTRGLGALLCSTVASHAALAGGGGGITIIDNNTHIDRGVDYTASAFLTASGGTAPYTFNVTAGVPSGIVINSDGTLTGVTCGSNGT